MKTARGRRKVRAEAAVMPAITSGLRGGEDEEEDGGVTVVVGDVGSVVEELAAVWVGIAVGRMVDDDD